MPMQAVADAAQAARLALDRVENANPHLAADLAPIRRALSTISTAARPTVDPRTLEHYTRLAAEIAAVQAAEPAEPVDPRLELDTPVGRLRGGSRSDGPLLRGRGWSA